MMVAEYTSPRKTLYGIGVALGAIGGFANVLLGVDTSLAALRPVWLFASLAAVVVLHEGTHGAVAALLGHRPVFGSRPPLVYVTFKEKMARAHFIAIAVAPLVILDLLFVLLFFYGGDGLRLYCDLCLVMNTIGSLGDAWVVLTLVRTPKGILIQDTDTGIQVWDRTDATGGRRGQSAIM